MQRGKPRRAILGVALGDRFSTLQEILASEKVPKPETLIAGWDELQASRLDHFFFQTFTNQHSGITNLPAYGVWQLFNGPAIRARARGVNGRRNGDAAITVGIHFVAGNRIWLYVRDELTSTGRRN